MGTMAVFISRDCEAGLAGSFEAGLHGGEAGGDVILGEGEEGGLGGEVGGFEVLGDLVEGLPDSGIIAPHGVWWICGGISVLLWWDLMCGQLEGFHCWIV